MSPAEEDALIATARKQAANEGTGIVTHDQVIRLAIRAAVAAQKEADAKVCEQIGKDIVCPEECAAAIREGTK